MRHSNFCKKDSMSDGCYDSHIKCCSEMLQRKYPEYDGHQYVLWIVPELFHDYASTDITGYVDIIKKDGTKIETKQILRTPYPNKRIYQISTPVGKKRVYGIPLIFDTFDELCEIENVHIRFDIYSMWSLGDLRVVNEKPLDLHIYRLDVVYHIDFSLNPENDKFKIFTVFSKDDVLSGLRNYHYGDDYFNQFDIAICSDGSILNNDDEYCADSCETVIYQGDENDKRIAQAISDFGDNIPTKERVTFLSSQTQIRNEIQYRKYLYEKTETVVAEELPDILPEHCFGFREPVDSIVTTTM